jgi:hypothetical protein
MGSLAHGWRPSSHGRREPHRNFMSVWQKFGDKSELVSHLPQTTLYAVAAKSTPETVRTDVIERFEAGKQIQPRDIKKMITTAKQAKKKPTGGTEPADDGARQAGRAHAADRVGSVGRRL